MKKIILLIGFALLLFTVNAQVVPNRDEKIPNATTPFGQNLADGTKITDTETNISYKVESDNGVEGTYTVTTALAAGLIAKDGQDEQQLSIDSTIVSVIDKKYTISLENGGSVSLHDTKQDLSGVRDTTSALLDTAAAHLARIEQNETDIAVLESADNGFNTSVAWNNGTNQFSVTDGNSTQAAEITGFVETEDLGVSNGVATLDGDGKLTVTQLPDNVWAIQGSWSALNNTPTLEDGVGTEGDAYYVNLAGSQDLGSGIQNFKVGDWIVYTNTGIWIGVTGSFSVRQVNGKTGDAVVDLPDFPVVIDSIDSLRYDIDQNKMAIENTITQADNDYVKKAGDTVSGNLNMYGNAANIALGSNFLSGDGDDEGVFINNNGEVSILNKISVGKYDPSVTLDVKGRSRFFDDENVRFLEIYPNSSNINIYSNWASGSKVPLIFGSYFFRTNQLVLDTLGNVGIGTTNPSEKLEVSGNVKANEATLDTHLPPLGQVKQLISDSAVIAGNQLSFDGNTLNVEEGTGSGLDADLLDGFSHEHFIPLITGVTNLDSISELYSLFYSAYNPLNADGLNYAQGIQVAYDSNDNYKHQLILHSSGMYRREQMGGIFSGLISIYDSDNANSETVPWSVAQATSDYHAVPKIQMETAIAGLAKLTFQQFSESTTGSGGDVHTLSHTPIDGSVQVEYNGKTLATSAYTVSSNTVQITQYVYKFDQLTITYQY